MDADRRTQEHPLTPFPPGLTETTLVDALRRTALTQPDDVALRSDDGRAEITWQEYAERVDAIAAGLATLGVGPGDTVGILLPNRPEWQLVDAAALTLGAVPFSLYLTSSPEQLREIQATARARIVVTDASRIARVRAARLPGVAHIVSVDDTANGDARSLSDLEAQGRSALPETAHVGSPDDVATLIYTSGTTGPPKGVELTHANVLFVVRAMHDAVPVVRGRLVSYLPHAHVVDRLAAYWTAVATGSTVTCVEHAAEVPAALRSVRPTRFNAVPRFWEKLQASILDGRASMPPADADALDAALAVARARTRVQAAEQPVPEDLEEAWQEAERTVLAPLRDRLGLSECRWTITGSGPLNAETHEFFAALGLPLCDLWGMSETAGVGTISTPASRRAGTVGVALPDTELRLADDGEVLVRGPHVMRGYRLDPTRTAEAVDPDGWLATGDIGRLDDDGHVGIVDRKKELIVGSAGKNMSPANIETALKGASALIGQACCIGDARPYNVALLVLDAAGVRAWEHAAPSSAEADDATLDAAVADAVRVANARLSRPEQIKRYVVLDREWMPDGAELTPTMKLRRRAIAAKYAGTIDGLYAGTEGTPVSPGDA
jgi:long-chain acyl-CoA synthetase